MSQQQDTKKTSTEKLLYERPVLKRIELKTDEVLAASCRNSTDASPFNDAGCGIPPGCST